MQLAVHRRLKKKPERDTARLSAYILFNNAIPEDASGALASRGDLEGCRGTDFNGQSDSARPSLTLERFAMLASPQAMRVRTFLFITVLLLCHLQLWPQAVTDRLPKKAPESSAPQADPLAADGAANTASPADSLPDAPGFPVAQIVPAQPSGVPVRFEYDRLEKHGTVYTLTGKVAIHYKNYVLLADRIVFDQSTSRAVATGHVELDGGPDDEIITADRGTVDFNAETGEFYNVRGSIGARPSASRQKLVYTTANPFLFTGREVIKKGPMSYQIVDGTMTSCRLPAPDWQILAGNILVSDGKARAKNGIFKLLHVPILYLPYVTHAVDTESRQSGLLIPVISNSSIKGEVFGEAVYWVVNRSADATLGAQYFSKRGWSPSGELRYHGRGEDFANLQFTALFDRGLPPDNLNQGGQDIVFSGRHDFDPDAFTRIVASGEYLSSYVYRQAFADTFALATNSQVVSSAFLTHNEQGFSESLRYDRYQNFQGISLVGTNYFTPQILISHIPSLDLDTVEHRIQAAPALWSFDGSLSGLSRSEPGFNTGGVGRFDFHPQMAFPLHAAGWTFRPELGVRETFYTQRQIPTSTTPMDENSSVNRQDVEAGFVLRPPVLMRDFKMPWLEHLIGSDLRHTVEGRFAYQYVGGVNNFSSIPRFDATDVVSDTSEADFALTQRLFLRRLHPQSCANAVLPSPLNGAIVVPPEYRECGNNTDAWISWTLAAKYFFDPTFGGAVVPGRRNVLATTLDLTGVAFLGGPRNYSPIVSQLKVRTSQRMDLEWDIDYDTKEGRINASNIYADYRRSSIFGSVGYSVLDALNPEFAPGAGYSVTKYNLLRLLVGYGNTAKAGLALGANAGYDFTEDALQYGGIQTSYNWNCCGLSLEYRRLALGALRNENQESFSFTLAGVGSAGNLKHSEQIF